MGDMETTDPFGLLNSYCIPHCRRAALYRFITVKRGLVSIVPIRVPYASAEPPLRNTASYRNIRYGTVPYGSPDKTAEEA